MKPTIEVYKARHKDHLVDLAQRLEVFFYEKIAPKCVRIDRISARAKDPKRFETKANKVGKDGSLKYSDPINEIQDQIGVRIITFYATDVQIISNTVLEYLSAIETKSLEPETEDQFGYFGKHFILPIPADVVLDGTEDEIPEHFELQVKTLFQHAWAEANHDIAYKPEHGELTPDQARMIAYAAAQAWGADRIFDEIAAGRIFANIKSIR